MFRDSTWLRSAIYATCLLSSVQWSARQVRKGSEKTRPRVLKYKICFFLSQRS